MPQIHHSTLPNGLRFFAVPLKGTQAASTFVVFQVGSRYETNDIAGVSHFLEHMLFKGTTKRPNPSDITRELDGLGAEYNAFTSKDWTGYYVKSAAEHFDQAFGVIADIIKHSKFASSAIARERNVILEELRMYLDNPLMHIEDLFEQLVFGATPLGRDIIGFRKTILGTTRTQLVDYYRRYYHPRNMVVVVAGNLDAKAAERKVQRAFGSLKGARRAPYFTCTLDQSEPQLVVQKRTTEQAQVALGFRAYRYDHPQLPALEVLHAILGGGMSSRLFEHIREQHGLAYSIRTAITSYEDTGTFYVRAGVDPRKALTAVKKILVEVGKVRRKSITAEEVARAKRYLTGGLALELEESDNYASWVAKQALFLPKVKTVAEVHAEIDAVTLSQVRATAREVLTSDRLNLALIGPFKSEAPFAKALRAF
jgi:predicted Zn-dependent peptidase